MKTRTMTRVMVEAAVLATLALGSGNIARLQAKDKAAQVDPNDPTYQLYNLLDSKHDGKLDDFCVLAGMVADPKNPGQSQQQVLKAEYDKTRGFGKLRIYVRTVAPLTPDQLKAYDAKQIFDFAETDVAKFTKTDPGPFGKQGDVYFEATPDGGPLATASVTPEVQAEYEHFISQYILPALQK